MKKKHKDAIWYSKIRDEIFILEFPTSVYVLMSKAMEDGDFDDVVMLGYL